VIDVTVEDVRDTMFKDLMAFARPRFLFHVQVLRKEFNREVRMPSDNLSDLERYVTSQKALSVDKKWGGGHTWKHFKFPAAPSLAGQGGTVTDSEISCNKKCLESHDQLGQEVRHAFDGIVRFCDPTTSDPKEDIGNLIKLTHKFQTDIRNRAAFNSYFGRHFKFDSTSASRARRALLFMCRFYFAASTFAEAARQIPSFRKVSFVLVKPFSDILSSQKYCEKHSD
jgi:hypothetical protein